MRWKKSPFGRNSTRAEISRPESGQLPCTDSELIESVRLGDESAFHELVDRYADYLFGVAFSLTGNAADAEDALQETFVAMLKGSGTFRHQASVKTWLVRILVKQCALARRRRGRTIVLPIWGNAQASLEHDAGLAVAPSAGQVDARVDVMHMLQTLSPEHRQVMILREMEGMSYDEMAQALGVPQGTVESRLHRARQELRERFKGYL
jgi:RNA polymerase sigma-70 factor (ECF subfamily)